MPKVSRREQLNVRLTSACLTLLSELQARLAERAADGAPCSQSRAVEFSIRQTAKWANAGTVRTLTEVPRATKGRTK